MPHRIPQSRTGDVRQKFPKKEREAWLADYLQQLGESMSSCDDGLSLKIDYAFYDTSSAEDERPQICYDPGYHASMRHVARNVTPQKL